MISSSTNGNSATKQGQASLLKEDVTTEKKQTKKIKKSKKKIHQSTKSEKPLEISCYKDLHSRGITTNDDVDRSIKGFTARVSMKSKAFEREEVSYCDYICAFPVKLQTVNPELDAVYKKLIESHDVLMDVLYQNNNQIILNTFLIEKTIIDLMEIKQKIVTIWNKNNLIPYKYGSYSLDSGFIKLEDEMLDYVQYKLFECYKNLNDDKNKQLIIDQLIEQKSIICSSLLVTSYYTDLSDSNNLDKLNFTDILTRFSELDESYSKITRFQKIYTKNRHNSSKQLGIVTSLIKMFLKKNNNVDYFQLGGNHKLLQTFSTLVVSLASAFYNKDDYIKDIYKLSVMIDFYYSNLDKSLFKGIHNALLSEHSIIFLEEFTLLISELQNKKESNNKSIKQTQSNKKRLAIEVAFLTTDNEKTCTEIEGIQKKIKELFLEYNIPIDDISSWYDVFMGNDFREIFCLPVSLMAMVVQWIDFSITTETKKQVNTEEQDRLNAWLDILANDYKNLIDDKIEWSDMPEMLLFLLFNGMAGEAIRFTFGTLRIAKQEDIAIFYAKTTQIFKPFLGTALLAIAHKDSYDDLLSDMDMLEFISKQTGKTRYVKSSKYLIAQIITYLLDKNTSLNFKEKQFLVTKAEKLYLELADAGINQAYLLLAETVASLAKAKMYAEDFLEAAKFYDQASNYCEILSKVDNLESDLQGRAIINMNCFSAEAEVLRKINEEQTTLLDDLETPTTPNKTTKKKKKKSYQKTVDIAKTSEQQELAEEITETELANWHQTYKTTASKPQGQKATKVKKTKKTELVAKLPTRDEIDSKRNFWKTTKKLLESSTNFEASYTLLVNLTQNNYFKMLESQFKNGIIEQDSWVILFVYQQKAYHHFLQLKHAKEIGNKNIKLFHTTSSKIKGATKAEKVTFEKLSTEAEQFIRQIIKLVCTDIPDIETKDIRELILSLSPNDYSKLPQLHKSQLASSISTYGHLKSLEDIARGNKGGKRLAAKPYAKADEINPCRLIRKQQEKQAS